MGERREREEVKTNRKTDHYVPTVSLITDQEPKKESTLVETCAKKTKEILKKNPGNYSDEISRLPENLITSVLGLLDYKEMFALYYRSQYPLPPFSPLSLPVIPSHSFSSLMMKKKVDFKFADDVISEQHGTRHPSRLRHPRRPYR